MSMKQIRLWIVSMIMILNCCNMHATDSIKGIWSGVESFPIFHKSFWQNIGYGFGAPPTGYVYSFSVYNDTQQPTWVATQGIVSIMGGAFPKAGDWNVYEVAPGNHYTSVDKEYYFEMFVKTDPNSFSNHMPYLQHSGVLYQQDLIQLQKKHSQHKNYFRVYMGKDFQNGAYVHTQKAEYLGYMNMGGKSDPNAISITQNLSSLIIENSTNSDFYIGFTTTVGATTTTMTPSTCLVFSKVAQNSFAQLSLFSKVTSLRPGSIGLFDGSTQKCIQVVPIAQSGFANMTYTLEIYQDASMSAPTMTWQGLMSGHYDMPLNRIRDITPIDGYFWYQSAAQIKNGTDLPGTVWIVAFGSQPEILGMATPGQAIHFIINRPEIGITKNIYFIYVDETDVVKSQKFIQKFLNQSVGADMIKSYHAQAKQMMQNAALQMQPVAAASLSKTAKATISSAVLSQAVAGSLKFDRGQIVDSATGTIGYVLGGDVFLSWGIGSTAMYYTLPSSIQTTPAMPTSAVTNVFAEQGQSTAPKGMPKAIESTYRQ